MRMSLDSLELRCQDTSQRWRPFQGDPDLPSYPFRFGLVFADQHKSYRARVAETMGRDEDTFYRSTIVPRFERSIDHPLSFLDSTDSSFPLW